MTDVTIIGVDLSPFVWAVRMCAAEKGVDYAFEGSVQPGETALAQGHPLGKIPLFKHGDFMLCETQAIMRYIDKAFDGPALFPTDVEAAARTDQWLSMLQDMLGSHTFRGLIFEWSHATMGGGEPNQSLVDHTLPMAERILAVMNARLAAGPYLSSDTFGPADIYAYPLISSLRGLPGGKALTEDLPALRNWHKRIRTGRASAAASQPAAFTRG